MLMLTSAPHRMKIAHFGTGVLLEGYFQKKGERRRPGPPDGRGDLRPDPGPHRLPEPRGGRRGAGRGGQRCLRDGGRGESEGTAGAAGIVRTWQRKRSLERSVR
jgi:hypothetical protein